MSKAHAQRFMVTTHMTDCIMLKELVGHRGGVQSKKRSPTSRSEGHEQQRGGLALLTAARGSTPWVRHTRNWETNHFLSRFRARVPAAMERPRTGDIVNSVRVCIHHPQAFRVMRMRYDSHRLKRWATKCERTFSTTCDGQRVLVHSRYTSDQAVRIIVGCS